MSWCGRLTDTQNVNVQNDEKHTHTMEYYSAIKKKEILPFATKQVNLEDIMLSEISQTEKDKGSLFSLVCGI